ncbi:hypothetical protein VNO80_32293 [Phaseolus coccineus]|uniref:Uncharacterized protein n=1 Tax=Phaseolus coccineus TaxID=3886 RepID=A0AAN9L025_PHACN
MHPPSRCACFVVKGKSTTPIAWLIHQLGLVVTHGGAGSGGRFVARLWASVCVAYFNTCEHKIGGMASHRSREGGHHVWLVTGRGYCLVPLGKGFIFGLVAATRGKARSHCGGFSFNHLRVMIRLDDLGELKNHTG